MTAGKEDEFRLSILGKSENVRKIKGLN